MYYQCSKHGHYKDQTISDRVLNKYKKPFVGAIIEGIFQCIYHLLSMYLSVFQCIFDVFTMYLQCIFNVYSMY